MTNSKPLIISLTDIYHQTEVIMAALERHSKEEFLCDEFYQNAFLRSLEIIGEAAKNVPVDFREKHPNV